MKISPHQYFRLPFWKLHEHAPTTKKEVVSRPNSPWFNADLAEAKRKCRRAERAWMKEKTVGKEMIHREERLVYNALCKEAQRKYYQQKLEESAGNQKELYKLVDRMKNKKKVQVLPVLKEDGDLPSLFADFFENKIKKISQSFEPITNLPLYSLSQVEKPLNKFTPTTEDELKKIILSGNNKCCHLDPLPTFLLKENIDVLLAPLTRLVNTAIEESVIPQSLKAASITPLIKKPSLDPNDTKNYRPVSNLPYVSKLVEKVLVKQIHRHLVTNNLYKVHQSAYRQHHSTETALVKISNDILTAMDQNQCVFLVLLDQSAAFDTVNQDLLLHKLRHKYGITGSAHQLLTSYFKGRTQAVTVNKSTSSPKQLDTGFPQGSVLGPYMYPLYTADLFEIAERHGVAIHMYADDTQLYVSCKPENSGETLTKMEAMIDEVRQWMANNHLKLNDSKTEFMKLGKASVLKQIVHIKSIRIGSTQVEPVTSAKNIGVTLDQEMNLSTHINNTVRNCYYHLRQISVIRPYLTHIATETLINAVITSRLDYCNSLYVGLPDCSLGKLQLIQNNAAKVIFQKKRRDHATPLLKTLHWLKVEYRIKFKINLLSFKALHGKAPPYLSTMIAPYKPSRALRSADKGSLVKKGGRMGKRTGARAFSVCAPVLWDEVPQDARDCLTVEAFKKSLKTHYFKKCFE